MSFGMKAFYNSTSFLRSEIPLQSNDAFFQGMQDSISAGWRVCSYFGIPAEEGATLYCVMSSRGGSGILGIASTEVSRSFQSLAARCPQLDMFEREIAEQCLIRPEGHPWFKPVRFQKPLGPGTGFWSETDGAGLLPAVTDFYQVEGDEIHEVAVGPVHAGIIEPGHFRFQCHGEEVFHLEIAHGFQHRGIERAMIGTPTPRTMHMMETIAGDTTVGHGQAYCMNMEALARIYTSPRAETVRGMALELERLANHIGDLGAIAGDVGYLPTASFCGRIRGDFLNMTALLCGSRFGRGLLRPGGVGYDCDAAIVEEMGKRLQNGRKEVTQAVELLWSTPSVMARLEETGTVSEADAREIGLVGPAARASGLNRDIRRDHPFGIFRMSQIPVITCTGCDVYARTMARWLEVERSLDFLDEQIRHLPRGGFRAEMKTLAADRCAVALTEGWRGEICHVALTDERGDFERYKIVDPSFHNWSGLALALRNQQISDFPLCNKSFNLSYCGFDL
ncbi:MAG: hydrogenase [Desulfuromonadaceae bacterium]|nr:hydrogenase [Desulfuromonadaceae bacterium]MDD5107320.1 hydrogenase [Desulfuromonadaceae bacterium]